MPAAQPKGLSVPKCEIHIDGSPLAGEVSAYLKRTTVDDSVDLPSMFAIEFGNSDAEGGTLILDQPQFDVGRAVEVKLGHDQPLATLVSGEITGMEADYTASGLPRVTVRGYDRRHRLQRGRKVQTYVNQKDSDIAATIARQAGLTPRVTDSEVVHDYVLQANQTDMEFLLERARRIQYQLTAKGTELYFQPVPSAQSADFTLRLTDDLIDFHPRLSSVGQVSDVSVRGWNPKNKESIVADASSGAVTGKMGGSISGPALAARAFGKAVGRVSDLPVDVKGPADQVAAALLNASALAFITGEGTCAGRPEMRAGRVIQLDGLGKRFSGLYLVTSVSHRFAGNGYTTHFTVRRNAT
jgi:Bacteriophage probable baseplate hub protein